MVRFLVGTCVLSFPVSWYFGSTYGMGFATCFCIGGLAIVIDWTLVKVTKTFQLPWRF